MKHPVAAVLACVCLMLGCTAGSATSTDAGKQANIDTGLPPPGSFVVVAADAPVLVAARDDARQLPSKRGGLGRIATVVGASEGFIELETVDTSELRPCARGFDFGWHARLRLFVRPDALQPVLRSSKTVSFDDGTKIELVPGAPVSGIGERARVAIGEAELIVPVDVSEVGRWFDAIAPVPSLKTDSLRHGHAAGLTLRYGEHSFEADPAYFGVGHNQQGSKLTFANNCGRFVLLGDLPPDAPEGRFYRILRGPKHAVPQMARNFDPDTAARSVGILGLMQAREAAAGCPKRWFAPTQAQLRWPEGGEAGVLLREHLFASEPDRSGPQVCFELGQDLEVCVPSSAISSRDNELCSAALGAE